MVRIGRRWSYIAIRLPMRHHCTHPCAHLAHTLRSPCVSFHVMSCHHVMLCNAMWPRCGVLCAAPWNPWQHTHNSIQRHCTKSPRDAWARTGNVNQPSACKSMCARAPWLSGGYPITTESAYCVMSCYAMPCDDMLYHVAVCNPVSCCVMLWHTTPCHDTT